MVEAQRRDQPDLESSRKGVEDIRVRAQSPGGRKEPLVLSVLSPYRQPSVCSGPWQDRNTDTHRLGEEFQLLKKK